MSAVREFLNELLTTRMPPDSARWLADAASETRALASNASAERHAFPTLFSLASRHVPRRMLAPKPEELAQAFDLVEGWNPERWTLLEGARAVLMLSRTDLEDARGIEALEECFRYADVGELCALYKLLALLPAPERCTWRAGEGCRSSMRAVFESAACDTPFAFRYFDDLAWRQLVIKALFVEAPLWRVYGLDQRIDGELARMALDLCDERRAAGREVQPELWLALGRASGERGREALERELAGTFQRGRRAAAIALARLGAIERLSALCEVERDPLVRDTMQLALKGRVHQSAYKDLDGAAR
jgi:hypothetical protein